MTRGKVGRVAVLVFSLAIAGGLAAAAADDSSPPRESRDAECTPVDYETVGCTFTHAGNGEPGGATPSATVPTSPQPATPAPPDPTIVYRWNVERDASGRPCWAPGGGVPEPDPVRREQLQREAERAYLAQSGGAELPPCYPDGVASGVPGGLTPDQPAFLREAEIRQQLGSPAPRIQPGRAITGKTAYLEIGGTGPQNFPVTDPLGGPGAHIEARPTYRVDWGDGTITETASAGGPWPRGDVTHVYQRTGHYDVVVTARWTARWSSPSGESGELTGLTTEGRIPRFPVTEVQAVRER